MDIRDSLVPLSEVEDEKAKPFCPEEGAEIGPEVPLTIPPVSLLTLDHLEGVRKRKHLHFAAEAGLKDAFQVQKTFD